MSAADSNLKLRWLYRRQCSSGSLASARLSAVFELKPQALPRFELQRFAAEDEGRTELPSERRKREEREKGNVARSQDLVSSSVLLGTVAALFVSGAWITGQSLHVFRSFLDQDYAALSTLNVEELRRLGLQIFWRTALIVAPVMAAAFVMGIAANIAQFGFLFTAQPLAFNPERIIPDFKRVLPVRRTLYNLLKILVQVVLIAVAGYIIVMDDFLPLLKSGDMGVTRALTLFAWTAFKLLIVTALILFGVAIPDYFYQRFEYMENLRVTVSEAKRERKEDEGDPMIRQRQRERAYQLRRQRDMLKEVPAADVVITNPTHFAVALQFDPSKHSAPTVVAKGADNLAFIIRTIARENGVPIEENPRLARVLYEDVEIGREIPETLFRVVSAIFARLQRFRRGAAV
ncbi:MAG: EscU/YscU/HrcU family type III secretion system export apparatus switch protein [Leptospirales bacterium]|nr:EscU/YscU/HrcU family type III secretion system export apparatus switch protein [Leptospirales bacterium]